MRGLGPWRVVIAVLLALTFGPACTAFGVPSWAIVTIAALAVAAVAAARRRRRWS